LCAREAGALDPVRLKARGRGRKPRAPEATAEQRSPVGDRWGFDRDRTLIVGRRRGPCALQRVTGASIGFGRIDEDGSAVDERVRRWAKEASSGMTPDAPRAVPRSRAPLATPPSMRARRPFAARQARKHARIRSRRQSHASYGGTRRPRQFDALRSRKGEGATEVGGAGGPAPGGNRCALDQVLRRAAVRTSEEAPFDSGSPDRRTHALGRAAGARAGFFGRAGGFEAANRSLDPTARRLHGRGGADWREAALHAIGEGRPTSPSACFRSATELDHRIVQPVRAARPVSSGPHRAGPPPRQDGAAHRLGNLRDRHVRGHRPRGERT